MNNSSYISLSSSYIIHFTSLRITSHGREKYTLILKNYKRDESLRYLFFGATMKLGPHFDYVMILVNWKEGKKGFAES